VSQNPAKNKIEETKVENIQSLEGKHILAPEIHPVIKPKAVRCKRFNFSHNQDDINYEQSHVAEALAMDFNTEELMADLPDGGNLFGITSMEEGSGSNDLYSYDIESLLSTLSEHQNLLYAYAWSYKNDPELPIQELAPV
jgi:hypothetical protein